MLADARTVPPSPLGCAISRHQFDRSVDRQLAADKPCDRCRCQCRILEKGAEQPQRAKLHRHAEPVVIAAMRTDECLVRVVEMEVTRELFRCRIADEGTIAQCLVVREKADRHCSGYAATLDRARRLPSSSLARSRGRPSASTYA